MSDKTPFGERSQQLVPVDVKDVRKHLLERKATGIIQESKSPFASSIMVSLKKNHDIQICVDYRILNRQMIPDQYTMLWMEDTLNFFTSSKWFLVLDLRSWYYH